MDIIEIQGLSRKYRNGPQALREVNLAVPAGCRFALLGVNGAGKSTLIRILCMLSRADSGTIAIGGIPGTTGAKEIRRLIGVALQDPQLDPEETPRAQLRFQGRLYGMDRKAAETKAEDLIARFRLGEIADRKTKDLSGGNKRRLHVALALVHGPKALFLDEPTVGMDPEIRADFWAEIRRLNEEDGVTVFFSTQYLAEAERNADELAVLDGGLVGYRGTIADFIGKHAGEGEDLESGFLKYIDARRAKEAVYA